MKKKLIILEIFRNKDEHYIDITKCALSIFSDEDPKLIINDRHILGEKPELNQFNLEIVKFHTNPIFRILQLIISFIKYKNANKLYLSTYPIFNLISILISGIQKGKSYHMVHGELGVFSVKNKKLRQKINYFIQKKIYKIVNKSNNIYMCFLDKSILSSIINKLKIKEHNNLISLDWPVNKIYNEKTRNESYIEIGLFGTQSKKKQSHLINFLESNLPKNKFIFKVVGHNDGIVFNKNIKIISPIEPNYHVDPKIFHNELSKCDYILSLSNCEDYEFIWSGTVITSLKYSIPILTLKNKTFNHYSNLAGQFGVEFDNIENLCKYLKNKDKLELRKQSIYFEEQINNIDRNHLQNNVLKKFNIL